jgi:dTDP-4-dehydrorhamnose reductase
MKRILVTGASGMLGAALVNELKKNFNIFATGNSIFEEQYINYKKFDLKSESYDELIKWSNPDIILLCGAITNGNYCEENPNESLDINGISIRKFLTATKNKVKIIYISTDAVFSSSHNLAKEIDCVSPENVYGKSKELGEFFLNSSNNRNYTIIRTTIVGLNINKEKEGFVEWIIKSSKNNEDFGLFTDVLFSPISIWDLATEINFLIQTDNINSETLHIAGETCTKYQFGYELLKTLNIPDKNLSKALISSFKDRAKRSKDQSLDSSFYQKKYNRKLPCLNQIILNIKKNYEYN